MFAELAASSSCLSYECEPVFICSGLWFCRSLHSGSSNRRQLWRLVFILVLTFFILPIVLILTLLVLIAHLLPHIDLLPPRPLRLLLPPPHDLLARTPPRNNIARDGLDTPVLKRRIKLVLQHLRQHRRDVLCIRYRRSRRP